MPFVMAGTFDDATSHVEEVLEILQRENGLDGFKVLMVGDASVAFESNELAASDIEQGERIGVPVALLIMLVLFGAVVAALIPIGLAIVSIVVALGATSLLGQVFELIFFVTLMITMIGLAVGIDYSLIVVSRFREEMERGLDKREAIALTGATAGRTVFFSGLTVVLAMSGLLIVPATVFQGLGAGAILVVIAAVFAALTLLPAVLVLLGSRVNALTLPIVGRRVKRQSGMLNAVTPVTTTSAGTPWKASGTYLPRSLRTASTAASLAASPATPVVSKVRSPAGLTWDVGSPTNSGSAANSSRSLAMAT